LRSQSTNRAIADLCASAISRSRQHREPLHLSIPKSAVICRSLDLRRRELSHIVSSGICLTFVSFLQNAATHPLGTHLIVEGAEAAAVVPDDLARAISLIGPPDEVKARLAALRAVGVTCVMANSVASTHRERVAQMEQLKDLLD
jgi:alkanesulfonate monooxygenase SsuD/methylene tetrahydromethanopterin reductase-like flavin-dependent oxidoreductase (luciferase family)